MSKIPVTGASLVKIEEKLRASLDDWQKKIDEVRATLESQVKDQSWAVAAARDLSRLQSEMLSARNDFRVVGEDMEAAKKEVEYRSALLVAYPSSGFLDKVSYLGTALLGAGGAAFLVETTYALGSIRYLPAVVLWLSGGGLIAYSLWGLVGWERSRWDFYAEQFNVPEKYRPRVLRKALLGIRKLFGL